MPNIFARVGFERDDGGQEQIVAFAIGTNTVVPRIAIANAEIKLIEFGVIDNRIPHRAAAAAFTPVTLFGLCAPGFGRRGFEDFVASGVVGFTLRIWRGVETPCFLAGRRIISSHITARTKFSATKANYNLVLHHTRDPGDGAVRFEIKRLRAPILLSGAGVEGNQTAINGADENAAFPESDTAIYHIATSFDAA